MRLCYLCISCFPLPECKFLSAGCMPASGDLREGMEPQEGLLSRAGAAVCLAWSTACLSGRSPPLGSVSVRIPSSDSCATAFVRRKHTFSLPSALLLESWGLPCTLVCFSQPSPTLKLGVILRKTLLFDWKIILRVQKCLTDRRLKRII